MTTFRKFIAVPENMDTNEPQSEPNVVEKRRIKDRFERMLRIAIKVSNINGFDDDFRIKRDDNTIVSNSNLFLLLNHLMTNEKQLSGLIDFIKLMARANVNPELIVNHNVKLKLRAYMTTHQNNAENNNSNNETMNTSVKEEVHDENDVNFEEQEISRNDASTNTESINNNVNSENYLTLQKPKINLIKNLKRKMSTDQQLDKSIGVGSSKEKYRKYNDNSPTDVVGSNLWDEIEQVPEQLPWDQNLPDDSDSE